MITTNIFTTTDNNKYIYYYYWWWYDVGGAFYLKGTKKKLNTHKISMAPENW